MAHRKTGQESGLAHQPRRGYSFLAYVSRCKQTLRGREFPQPTAAVGKRGVHARQRVPAGLRADAAGEKGRVDRRSLLYGFIRQRPPREAGWDHSSLARHKVEFRRVCDGANFYRKPLPFAIVLAPKQSNAPGMQIADLVARPIGIKTLRPDKANRAYEILEAKVPKEPSGRHSRLGPQNLPLKMRRASSIHQRPSADRMFPVRLEDNMPPIQLNPDLLTCPNFSRA